MNIIKKNTVLLSILTNEHTQCDEFGSKVLNYFYEQYPSLAPEFMHWWEPINKPVQSTLDALYFWSKGDVIWRRKKAVQSSGGIYHTGVYGAGALIFRSSFNKKVDWNRLFLELVKITNAKYAYLHYMTIDEFIKNSDELDSGVRDSFYLGAFDKKISDGLHNLAWLNYFGPDYAANVPQEKIKNSVHSLEDYHQGLILQLSPCIDDVITDLDGFMQKRREVKSCFPEDFFCQYLPLTQLEKDLIAKGLMVDKRNVSKI